MSELKNQELPPLDKASEVLKFQDGYVTYASVQEFRELAETQLLAALNELKAKDAELAAKEARIAELENTDAQKQIRGLLEDAQMWKDQASAAESKLTAVSEVLKEKLESIHVVHRHESYSMYRAAPVDAILTKARSIVEDK